jgi:hypothetical protein
MGGVGCGGGLRAMLPGHDVDTGVPKMSVEADVVHDLMVYTSSSASVVDNGIRMWCWNR